MAHVGGGDMVGKVLSRWIDYIVEKTLRRLWQQPRRILRDYVKAGMTVLDVGCGTGFFSLAMAKMVGPDGRVVCVDLKIDAVKSLEGRAAEPTDGPFKAGSAVPCPLSRFRRYRPVRAEANDRG